SLVAVRLRHPGLALPIPYLGSARLRLFAQPHSDAPCRGAEKIWPVRFDSHCDPVAAGCRAKLDAYRRMALPGQSPLLRLGGDEAERFQLAGRIFERRPYGIRF